MAKKKAKAPRDMVLLHSRTEDGEGIRAIRSRADSIELAELRPLKEGQPLSGSEIVRLHPHKELPMLCDVEVQYSARTEEGRGGPAQVASDTYRQNWNKIFGGRSENDADDGEEEEPSPPKRKLSRTLTN